MMLVDLQFYVFFNSVSVISGPYDGDHEKFCAMDLCLQPEQFPPPALNHTSRTVWRSPSSLVG